MHLFTLTFFVRCGSQCNLTSRNNVDGLVWRCKRKGCQSVTTIRKNSFFEGSHLTLSEILQIVYWWTRDHSLKETAHETGIEW